MGVKELSMPANELSILFAMADAKRNAGNRLPVMPERMMIKIFLREFLLCEKQPMEGRQCRQKNFRAAICEADNSSLLCFIKINELPRR